MPQLPWTVAVVIVELQPVSQLNAHTHEGPPKRLGIAQPAECSSSLERTFRREVARARAGVDPCFGPQACVKYRSARIPAPDLPLDGARQVCEVAARDDYQIRARQTLGRLAQAAQGKDTAPAEGTQRIDHHNVHCASKLYMLESVVEEQHIHAELAFQCRPTLEAIFPDTHRRQPRTHEQLRLLAAALRGGFCGGRGR